jgi:hypothetical protein
LRRIRMQPRLHPLASVRWLRTRSRPKYHAARDCKERGGKGDGEAAGVNSASAPAPLPPLRRRGLSPPCAFLECRDKASAPG